MFKAVYRDWGSSVLHWERPMVPQSWLTVAWSHGAREALGSLGVEKIKIVWSWQLR